MEVLIRPTNILITNTPVLLQGGYSKNVNFGLVIGEFKSSSQTFMHLQNIPRYLGDRKEALKIEKESFTDIKE